MTDSRAEKTKSLLASPPDARTIDALLPYVYDELRQIARRQLSREHARTLKTTALVHEAYLRLVDEDTVTSKGRPYFFAAASQAMRRILIDRARKRKSAKRGAGNTPLPLDGVEIEIDTFAGNLLDLDTALNELARRNKRQALVVECRFFGGMATAEIAKALDVSVRTVQHDWTFARAWLLSRLDTW